MDIQEGYEANQLELNAFTQKVMDDFRNEGVQVDPNSYRDHCYRVFVLGKLRMLEEQVMKNEENTKECKNYSAPKETKNVKKRSSKKAGSKGTDDQLGLGI